MGEEMAKRFKEFGIESYFYPVIENQAIAADFSEVDENIQSRDCAWIFISKSSVQFFHAFLIQHGLTSWQPAGKVIAVGESTKKQLMTSFDELDVITPEQPNSESLLRLSVLDSIKQVVTVKGLGGRGLIKEQLEAKGKQVISLNLYQRAAVVYSKEELAHWNKCNLILSTSVDIAKSIFSNLSLFVNAQIEHEFLHNKKWIVLSERIKTFLIQKNVESGNIFVCEQSDNSSIINMINKIG